MIKSTGTLVQSASPAHQSELDHGNYKRSAADSDISDGLNVEENADLLASSRTSPVILPTPPKKARVASQSVQFIITWRGSCLPPIPIHSPATQTIRDLKGLIEVETSVPIARQKFIGLVKGKCPEDGVSLDQLLVHLKPMSMKTLLTLAKEEDEDVLTSYSCMLLGTPDEELMRERLLDESEVLDDVDFEYFTPTTTSSSVAVAVADAFNLAQKAVDDEANTKMRRQALQKMCAKMAGQLRPISPPRPGKKLLVLDLDYTLFDCKSTTTVFSHLIRPGTHEFLTALYPYYDLVIWSQTSWRWLEAKITEMGLLSPSREYRLTFVVDKSAMFQVTRRRPNHAESRRHHVKPLQVIWSEFPTIYTPSNTVHVDDLGRNFAMNPQCGLKIPAFKNGPVSRLTDRELLRLASYLIKIAELPDLSGLNHKDYKKYRGPQP